MWQYSLIVSKPKQENLSSGGCHLNSKCRLRDLGGCLLVVVQINPYPTAFPYGNGMVLHFYHQQESSTTKTVHKVINKGLKTYV